MNINRPGNGWPAHYNAGQSSSAQQQSAGTQPHTQPTDPRLQGLTRLPGPHALYPGRLPPAPHSIANATPLHMSPSEGWSQHLFDEAVTDLNDEMRNNGLAHVAWGSKPMFYLESADESGSWPHLALALKTGMKNGFALIPHASNAQKPADEQEGYLLNIGNTLRVLDQHKALFAERLNAPPTLDSASLLQHFVMPMLANKRHDEEPEMTAALLGYGVENAHVYSRIMQGSPAEAAQLRRENQEINAYTHQRLDQIANEKGLSHAIPAIPKFMKTQSPATMALLDRYIDDSSRIQDGQASLIDRYDRGDDESLEREPRLLASALMRKMCNEPE